MKKQRKSVELDERQKRLLLYISLLIGAIFFAIWDPTQLWLVIGLGIGIVYGLANDWIFNRKKPSQAEQPPEVSTKIAETVENKNEVEAGRIDKEEESD